MKKLILILLLFTCIINAQNVDSLSGNVHFDSQIAFENTYIPGNENIQVNNKKSGFLAGVLSAVVPGAGEIYSEQYLKAALFMAVEVAAVYLAVDNDQKGDDQTEVYQDFAEANWDPAKYARNSITNFNLDPADYEGLFLDEEMTKIDYSRWDLIHKIESDVSDLDDGKYYSHELADYQEQQYYEMIGKYQQFNNGWNDFDFNPEVGFDYHTPLTDNFQKYSGMRGEANDYYNKASTFVTVVVINHVISAIDAVLSTKWYNDKVKMNAEVGEDVLGYERIYYPKFNLSFNF